MELTDKVLAKIRWVYYALSLLIVAASITAFPTYLYWYAPNIGSNYWSALLILVMIIFTGQLLRLIVFPYFYIWAFSQTSAQRKLQYVMQFELPFYPVKSWYYNLLPFFGQQHNQVKEIVAGLNNKVQPAALDLSEYETTQELVAKKVWGAMLFQLAGALALALIFAAGYIFDRSLFQNYILNLFVIVLAPLLLYGSIRVLFAPRHLAIGNDGIKVGQDLHQWNTIKTVCSIRQLGYFKNLQILLKSGKMITFPLECFNKSEAHMYSKALYHQLKCNK